MSDQGQVNNEQTERECTKTVPEKPMDVEAHGNDNVGSEAEGEVTDEAGGKLEIQPKKYPSRVRRPPDRYGRRCNNLMTYAMAHAFYVRDCCAIVSHVIGLVPLT